MKTKHLPLLFSLLFFNCYLFRQGVSFLSYQRKAVPVDRIISDTTVDDSLIEFLNGTTAIRLYARDSLGLSLNDNFTTFVETDKRSIVSVVTACAPDTFNQHTWWFPIVGKMPYKGFYKLKHARKEVARLRKKGLDVAVRPAGAFSTLGFFKDPLYSYMTRYSPYRLASMIIHEQVHATIFLKSNADFNEAMAVFIGDNAALHYIKATRGESSREYLKARNIYKDEKTFISLVLGLYDELDSIYSLNLLSEEILELKQARIEHFKYHYDKNYDSLFTTRRYKRFSSRKINNAVLAEYKTYNYDVGIFEKLYRHFEYDMKAMIAFLKTIPKREKDPVEFIEFKLDK
ncbi:MAG: aminopeptidase [Chitinivibrionales bacterium]|nr:aminopeptidase [Chitinivibrionales bacterium]